MSKRTYITSARLAVLKSELQAKDWAVLSDVARINLATGHQLQRLHYEDSESGRRMARLDLRKLTQSDLLTRLERTVGGRRAGSTGYVYGLGVAGRRLVGPQSARPREPWTPSHWFMRHVLAVSELYVRLREIETQKTVTLEQFAAEPRCWRTFHGPGGSRLVLKPDAFVTTSTDDYVDSWFIELDRATESITRINQKTKAYYRYWQSGREQSTEGVFPTVLFIVPDAKREGQLVEAFSRLPAEQRQLFRVVAENDAAVRIANGELITNQREEVNQ